MLDNKLLSGKDGIILEKGLMHDHNEILLINRIIDVAGCILQEIR
jgi:hypothetical protein